MTPVLRILEMSWYNNPPPLMTTYRCIMGVKASHPPIQHLTVHSKLVTALDGRMRVTAGECRVHAAGSAVFTLHLVIFVGDQNPLIVL